MAWYNTSIEVVVATVSTTYYQYLDGVKTSYSTQLANITLPTTAFTSTQFILPGMPTSLIDGGHVYEPSTFIVRGTEFTDPYGTVYQSPTPVLWMAGVTYQTVGPSPDGSGGYVCGDSARPTSVDYQTVYPSGE